MSDRPSVFVTRKLPSAVEERLLSGYDVTLNPDDEAPSAADLTAAMAGYDALVSTVSDRIDAQILAGTDLRVRIIANVGVGFNNIDVATATQRSIRVSNTPDVLTEATADIALFLILASTRGATDAERRLRAGAWTGFSLVDHLGMSVQGNVLGIVGMGRIGQATARKAALALGMTVVFFNRSPVNGLGFEATQLDSLEELMATADVVSLHVPGGASEPAVTAEHLALMKPTAHLVNTARGDSVDQDALIAALTERRIAGAGLDVYVDEPTVPPALRELPNVTLLPHVGSATDEVRTAMGMAAVDNLDAFFAGTELPSAVG